jgi:hypothetical protein
MEYKKIEHTCAGAARQGVSVRSLFTAFGPGDKITFFRSPDV